MFHKILVPVDGSDPSLHAVNAAIELAGATGGEVIVLHVREHELTWAVDMDVETEPEAIELVDAYVRVVKDAAVSARGEVLRAPHGQTPWVILEFARTVDADVIVMASHGRSPLGRLLLGSVTTRVLHLASCPVLVLR